MLFPFIAILPIVSLNGKAETVGTTKEPVTNKLPVN